MKIRNANRDFRNGVATMELVLVLPFVLILLFGIWDFGRRPTCSRPLFVIQASTWSRSQIASRSLPPRIKLSLLPLSVRHRLRAAAPLLRRLRPLRRLALANSPHRHREHRERQCRWKEIHLSSST